MSENTNYTLRIKHNCFNKSIDSILTTQTLGDLQEKILETINLTHYSIEYIEAVTTNNGTIIIGSDGAPYEELVINFVNNKGDIEFSAVDRKRDETGSVIKSNIYIEKYNNYLREREDFEITKRMQDDYNYSRYMGLDQNLSHSNQILNIFSNDGNSSEAARIFISSMLRGHNAISAAGVASAAPATAPAAPAPAAPAPPLRRRVAGGAGRVR